MKILIPVKHVVDYNVRIHVKIDGSGIEKANVKMSMNPFDEIAIEEGLKLLDNNLVKEIIIISIGPQSAIETIRHGLALGAHRAIHVKTDTITSPLEVSFVMSRSSINDNSIFFNF